MPSALRADGGFFHSVMLILSSPSAVDDLEPAGDSGAVRIVGRGRGAEHVHEETKDVANAIIGVVVPGSALFRRTQHHVDRFVQSALGFVNRD